MASNRPPYHGLKRKLVLAIDLGTTYSGISYAILDPGKAPEIKTVNRYPGQEAGDSKVQTVIWYDRLGNILATGAEEPPQHEEEGEDSGSEDDWLPVSNAIKVEWFKLLLGRQNLQGQDGIPRITLPQGRTNVVDVYADFYRYLFEHARIFIQETHTILWESVADDINFILTHPNGWEGRQQSSLREAAVKGGLVPDTREGRERIHFVTEGEASLHYCISSGLVMEAIRSGESVMVVDAGGGTVDVSTYTINEVAPMSVREIAAPECIYQGSVMVRNRAQDYIRRKLADSRFGSASYLDIIAEEFDKTTKKRFRGTGDSYVRFSGMRSDTDARNGIRNGQLKLSMAEVTGFFDPSIREIIRIVDEQTHLAAPAAVSSFFLVGGFAASEHLYSSLRDHLQGQGLNLFRPDNHTNKAVAEGAVSYHIDHFVSTRVARYTYGVRSNTRYRPGLRDHEQRAFKKYTNLAGHVMIPDSFLSILNKVGTQVAETTKFEKGLCRLCPYETRDDPDQSVQAITVLCYKGSGAVQWTDIEPNKFSALCTISADLSRVPKVRRRSRLGTPYYCLEYEVVLSFGLTELKAHISWMEDGQERSGPASVVYDVDDLSNDRRED
ncbi:uncharacterized protein STEHIDRAFT_160426 [Stereum hirsutum FP-91666 SS1]|uniref:uncharacterized protein n=1 Tax=Stereum hirsutum (strain FP-91666) TaxID=721885 RepID=UPI0004449D63|nr:uncharacterized protein STEHIDRAFT_160426 [Stereum hirsutum FP-91666 SS1]EIM82800.1 hypothetical protein STEHIDRAFT_160426 [Stereum hirsutum FP-91666 SS1]